MLNDASVTNGKGLNVLIVIICGYDVLTMCLCVEVIGHLTIRGVNVSRLDLWTHKKNKMLKT